MGFGASDPRATHTIRAFAGLPGRAGFLQAGPPSVRSLSARPANFSKAGNEASRVSSGDPNGCAQDLDAALQHQRRQKAKPEPPAAASGSLCAGMLTPAGPVRECSVTDSQGAARVMEAERSPVEVVCVDFRMLRASCGVAEVPAPPCGCPDACQLFLFLERRVKEKRVGGGYGDPRHWHPSGTYLRLQKTPLDGGIARYQATPNLRPWGLSLRQMVAGCSQLKMSPRTPRTLETMARETHG